MAASPTENATDPVDIAIVGAGAAGLMTAIIAGRTARAAGEWKNILLLDGARSLGAKILVAGGGRCNVTHETVDETAYSGSTPAAIRKVLRRFDVPETIEFFREIGVELKCEETGKLFPMTDSARTVLNALLNAARDVGVTIQFPWRVEAISRTADGFDIQSSDGRDSRAGRVVLATGGKSLPKSGSDGHGYVVVKSLGHTLTERIYPALVPMTLNEPSFVRTLSGVATPVTLEVRRTGGKRLASMTGSLLCTHFGISGPCAMDISRHYLDAKADGDAALFVNWIPGESSESIDSALLDGGRSGVANFLARRLPERLARALCAEADVNPSALCHALTRERRRALARAVCDMELPVNGDKGFDKAEVTAGGVPLKEIRLESMESRACDGLHLVGEILDVDGCIGGFNFQWAWASGFVAGTALSESGHTPP